MRQDPIQQSLRSYWHLDNELSSFYGKLMEARLDSDYETSFDPDPNQLQAWLPRAEEFIHQVFDLLDNPPS